MPCSPYQLSHQQPLNVPNSPQNSSYQPGIQTIQAADDEDTKDEADFEDDDQF
jgi:hypothetical protein